MALLDSLLNRLTMYRLMLYYLIVLVVASLFFSGFNPLAILAQSIILLLTCYLTNLLFSKIFKVPTNFESFAITALILTLIVGPFARRSLGEVGLLTIIAVLAMASKYLLVLNKRHIFNPAALAVTITAIFLGQGASWWIGNQTMLPFLILGGLIILRKIRRFSLVLVFLFVATVLSRSFANLFSPSLIFFASVMLIEPFTSPVFFKFQIVYAAAVATFFVILSSFVPYPLELSLLIGNLFCYLVSPTSRFKLELKHKLQLAPDIFAFYFLPEKEIKFLPGQYLEWTLSHPHSDSRGTRRFFTIASSPSEPEIMLVSKFAEMGSSFKKSLQSLPAGRQVFANGPAGEFTLTDKSLVFIAGGIGITPFRSMVKYLLDTNKSQDIILLYSAKTEADFVFKDLFSQAKIKTVYTTNRVDEELIKKEVPDFKTRTFYVSGPEPMVQATEKILRTIGISRSHIHRDYFPGYL